MWAAVVGEELVCRRERGNSHNVYAVAVMKDGVVVGQEKIACHFSVPYEWWNSPVSSVWKKTPFKGFATRRA